MIGLIRRKEESKGKQIIEERTNHDDHDRTYSDDGKKQKTKRHVRNDAFIVLAFLVALHIYYAITKTDTFVSKLDITNEYATMERHLIQYFDQTAREQATADSSSSINELISLRLGASHQAGFGNIMIGVNSLFMEAFVTNKFPLLNNCVILSMFQHPNPGLSFLNHGGRDGDKCIFDDFNLSKYSPNPNKKMKASRPTIKLLGLK